LYGIPSIGLPSWTALPVGVVAAGIGPNNHTEAHMAITTRTGEARESQQAAVLAYWDPFGILRRLMGWWEPFLNPRPQAPAQTFEVHDTKEAYVLEAGRFLALPGDAELDQTKAEFRDGLLRVEIPKRVDPTGARGSGSRGQEHFAGEEQQASPTPVSTEAEKPPEKTAIREVKGLPPARVRPLTDAKARPRVQRKHNRSRRGKPGA
jgi:hypothetical protein